MRQSKRMTDFIQCHQRNAMNFSGSVAEIWIFVTRSYLQARTGLLQQPAESSSIVLTKQAYGFCLMAELFMFIDGPGMSTDHIPNTAKHSKKYYRDCWISILDAKNRKTAVWKGPQGSGPKETYHGACLSEAPSTPGMLETCWSGIYFRMSLLSIGAVSQSYRLNKSYGYSKLAQSPSG